MTPTDEVISTSEYVAELVQEKADLKVIENGCASLESACKRLEASLK